MRKPTAERQEEILDAASRVLLREGVSALTMATLAEEVGVTTGALFRHFESRDAILVALAERTATRLREDLVAHSKDPPEERLGAFITARLGTVAKTPTGPAMVLSPDVHLALPPAGREALASVVKETHAHLRALIAEGQAAGVFRTDLPPEGGAMTVMGLLALQTMTRALPTPLARGGELIALARKLLAPPTHTPARGATP